MIKKISVLKDKKEKLKTCSFFLNKEIIYINIERERVWFQKEISLHTYINIYSLYIYENQL